MIQEKILRLPELIQLLGYSRSTIYLYITNGLLPKPVRIGTRSVGWPASEINQIMQARISGQPDAIIKNIISEIQSARAIPTA